MSATFRCCRSTSSARSMRIEYIAHSCFVIETGQKKIVFDPWITGSAYNDQWHLFPKPVDISLVEQADLVLISHGHEDHMHRESLKRITKKAHVFFPFQWRKGIVGYFKHLQYKKITEAVSFKTYTVDGIRITYLGYSLESVVVVECEGYVIVNVNDALNSNHETASQFLLEKIKDRWPKIDFLLSGWSGAGYFPNKVHYKNKDDEEVARIREQYFADNFCKFTRFLQPDIAVPFAPGFVLLRDENRWINDVKFSRQIIDSYYKEHFENDSPIEFPIMYPGDYFEEKTFRSIPGTRFSSDHELYMNIDEIFKEEIVRANRIAWRNEEELDVLETKLTHWLNRNKVLYAKDVVSDAIFSIEFSDVRENRYFNVRSEGGKLLVNRSDHPRTDDRLLIRTQAGLLALNLEKEWGGDLLSIGYGADVQVYVELSLEKNLDIVCMRLISRFPMFREDFKDHAFRMLRYYIGNPSLTNLWIKQKIKLRPYVNKYPFNERDHWITYSKCDLCKVCNLPELDFRSLP